jgi:Putative helicase
MRFWTRRSSHTPPVAGSLPVLEPKALLAPHQSKLTAIRKLAGVPKVHWQAFYLSAFEAYARFVQQLPASEAHHHAGPGGLLTHGLEVVHEALKLRRGRLIPLGASAETLATTQDLWTFATATAALLHDLGKPVADQRILLYDRRGRTLGSWDPWAGPIRGDAHGYRVEFLRSRSYRPP